MPLYLSVIMPAYNEEGVLAPNVLAVIGYLREHLEPGREFEIIVVDDGSTDGTGRIADQLESEQGCVVAVHHGRNMGRGRGLRSGFEVARGEYVVTLDSDLSYSPEHITAMLRPLEGGRADVVLCSAYHRDGKVENVPRFRAWVSRRGNRLLSLAVRGHFSTLTCMVRAYRREVVKSLELTSEGKQIHLEILLKTQLLGYKVVEIPATLRWRDDKRTSGKRGLKPGQLGRQAYEHLVFNFLFRPSLLFSVPILLLGLFILVMIGLCAANYINFLAAQPADMAWWLQIYHALRQHILHAAISYLLLGFSLVLFFQFVSMFFLAKQNKQQFDELYVLLSRMRNRHLRDRED